IVVAFSPRRFTNGRHVCDASLEGNTSMYKIIGADGKQYGPVSADELRQWIATGRANAATLAQIEGMTDWKPLSSFPEFSGTASLSPPPTNPSPSNIDLMAAEIPDYSLDFGACFS